MKKLPLAPLFRKLMPVALCLGTALPVVAQVLNGSAADPGATAEAAGGEQSAGPSYTQITRIYDNWSLQCRERSGEGKCYVETVVRQSKPEVRDVIVLRFSQAENGLEAVIVTPNRVKLDRGVSLTVGNKALSASYAICGPVNCNATLPPQEGLADLLKTQDQLAVSFHIFASADEGGEREIKIPVTLAGFATAHDHLVVFDAEQ